MKHKITLRLTLYFSLALLIFSLIVGSLFMILFKNHTLNLYKSDMERRADAITENLSSFMMPAMGPRQGFSGLYFRFLEDIAMSDVWIVDESLELITQTQGQRQHLSYQDLPPDAERLVKAVFTGEQVFSENFSSLLETPTLTLGTPIYRGSTIVGALLLHAPVEGINEAYLQGFGLLALSMLVALLLSLLLSVFLASSFTRPLNQMKTAALELSRGNYAVKTQIRQKDEIGELAQILDTLSLRLEESREADLRLNQMRQDFITNISHELRTPVTVLRGSLEALRDQVVTEPKEVRRYYDQMLQESIGLQRLVNDLLDLSRLQSPDFPLETAPFELSDLIQDLCRSIEPLAQKKGLYFKSEVGRPFSFDGDYGRVRQMLMIVLDNGFRLTPEGKNLVLGQDRNEVWIADEGPGITPEERPLIFERFYKGRNASGQEGSGLGLSIAKEIAQRHQIQIQIDSQPSQGSRFLFTFPSDLVTEESAYSKV